MNKNLTRIALTIVIAITCSISLSAQIKYSRVAISISQNQITSLQKIGLQFDHGSYNKDKQQFITTLSATDLSLLKQSSYSYKILIDDEAANLVAQNIGKYFYEDDVQKQLSPLPFGDENCAPVENSVVTPTDFTQGSMVDILPLQKYMPK